MKLKLFLLLGMLFLHLVDDYYLQGWLASAKQKSWWEKNAPEELYSHDYIMALCGHAFSWTFMIMLIPAVFNYVCSHNIPIDYFLFFVLNWVAHSIIDNFKANKKYINLIHDQLFHIIQIVLTWYALIVIR